MINGLKKYPLTVPTYSYPVYSNVGMAVLGQVAVAANREFEKSNNLTGSPATWPALAQRDIFDPLGLDGSSFVVTPQNKAHVAIASTDSYEVVCPPYLVGSEFAKGSEGLGFPGCNVVLRRSNEFSIRLYQSHANYFGPNATRKSPATSCNSRMAATNTWLDGRNDRGRYALGNRENPGLLCEAHQDISKM
jgi:CubicO group peptidase (beta-lactamase class C family)